MVKTVAIAGLGAIGMPLARALDGGIDGLRLIAVAARDQAKARAALQDFRTSPRLVALAGLAEADIVVEAAPAALFEQIASAAIEAGRIFVPASVGALLPRMHLVRRARETGARIVVPTGALLGLDAVRAAVEGPVESVSIETRKPPAGLAGAPYLLEHGIDVGGISTPRLVFEGNALDAAAGFPANVNVAAALALAGIGPLRTLVKNLGRSDADPQHPHHPRRSRGGPLHHDHRERAERGEPPHREADAAFHAGLPARPGGNPEGGKLVPKIMEQRNGYAVLTRKQGHAFPVIARSEATKQSPARDAWTERPFAGDCFVASLLAMTWVGCADSPLSDGGY